MNMSKANLLDVMKNQRKQPYGNTFTCTSLKNSQIKGAERFIMKTYMETYI